MAHCNEPDVADQLFNRGTSKLGVERCQRRLENRTEHHADDADDDRCGGIVQGICDDRAQIHAQQDHDYQQSAPYQRYLTKTAFETLKKGFDAVCVIFRIHGDPDAAIESGLGCADGKYRNAA